MNGMDSNAWSRYSNPSTPFVSSLAELGYKMNYTDLQAAIGRVQLRRLDEMASVRKCLVEHYKRRLESVGIIQPFQSGVFDKKHARHLLVGYFDPAITGIGRDDLLLALRALNIGASIHYRPLHSQPLYYRKESVPLVVTDNLSEKIMTLPISAKMSFDDVEYVTDQLAQVLMRAEVKE